MSGQMYDVWHLTMDRGDVEELCEQYNLPMIPDDKIEAFCRYFGKGIDAQLDWGVLFSCSYDAVMED